MGARVHAAALCLVFVVAAMCQAGPLPEIDRLLPAETIFVAGTADFSALRSNFEKTDIHKFYKDPAMAPFVESVRERFLKSLKEDSAFERFASADYPLPQGKAAIAAIMQPASPDGKTPDASTVFICQWGKELSKATDLVEKHMKDIEEKGGKRKREEYRGIQLISVFEPADEGKKDVKEEPAPDFLYCFIDDCFIASDRKEDMKFVIAHATDGAGGTLREDADYQAAVKRIGASDIIAYVNVRKLIETLIREEPESERFLKAAGFDKVTGIATGLKAAPDAGSSIAVKGYIRTSGTKQGILRILDMSPASPVVPDFVAGDTCSLAAINLDLSAAYDEIFRIANSIEPQAAAAMGSPLTAPTPDGRPGVDLKKDILAYLRPGLWSVDVPRKGAGADQTEILSIAAVAITDRSKLEQSLSRIHGQYFGSDKELKREFLGHVIYTISFGMPYEETEGPGDDTAAGEPSASMPSPTAFTVTDSHLLFGDVKLIEDAIRAMKDKTASRLPAAKWYRKAAAATASPAGSTAVMDLGAYGQYLWKMVKSADADSQMGFVAEDFKEHADFSKLPEFDAVKKYFGIIVSQFFSQPDGFTFEYRMLSAAEE